MNPTESSRRWKVVAVVLARAVLASVFLMAFGSKAVSIRMTADFIDAAGFPLPTLLAIAAALFELSLVVSFMTGAVFSELMLAGAVYVMFLAFAFHGPSHWTDPKGLELGAFVSHFPFAAALLYAAAHGPGRLLVVRRWRHPGASLG